MERTLTGQELGQEIAKKFADAVNGYSTKEVVEGFVDELSRQHRTLQQQVTGVMVGWLLHLASLPDNWYDARNEASVRFARRVMGGTEAEVVHEPSRFDPKVMICRAVDTFFPFI